jgi:hypothetical protein
MKARCEAHESVDLSWLSHGGRYDHQTPRVWKYSDVGLKIAAYPEPWAVVLEVEGHSHRIALSYTETRFGGRRPWFTCPGCLTHRRVLYYQQQGFACRACFDLRYTSEVEDVLSRASRQRRRILEKVGGHDPGRDFPVKPKGMHWKTYRALEAKAEAYLKAFAIGVAKMTSQRMNSP